jgi:hypothetical protein
MNFRPIASHSLRGFGPVTTHADKDLEPVETAMTYFTQLRARVRWSTGLKAPKARNATAWGSAPGPVPATPLSAEGAK